MMLRSGRNKAQFAALLVPGIIVFALFTVYPIVKLFVMSFLRWDLGSVFQKSFAGLENYKAVLSDETFFVAFEIRSSIRSSPCRGRWRSVFSRRCSFTPSRAFR